MTKYLFLFLALTFLWFFFCPIYVTHLTRDQKWIKFKMPSSVILSLLSVIYVDYLKALFIESVQSKICNNVQKKNLLKFQNETITLYNFDWIAIIQWKVIKNNNIKMTTTVKGICFRKRRIIEQYCDSTRKQVLINII